MVDRRRNVAFKKVSLAIMELLKIKPMQARDLKKELEKMDMPYSRDRINDILNLMMGSADIERKLKKNSPYPVYTVIEKSKLLAELNGIQFLGMFSYGMLKPNLSENLIQEFELYKHKKTKLDALLGFFGFIVLGSLIASRLYDKDVRSDWLTPILDLEKGWNISKFFDDHIHEEQLIHLVNDLIKKYPENSEILNLSIKGSKEIKKHTQEKGEGLEKLFKDFVDKYQEN